METERLIIRSTIFEDCEYFADWEKKDSVTEFFTISKDRNKEDILREYFERLDSTDKKDFTICLKAKGTPIGRIYISNIEHHYDSLDITRIYIADTALRGKGYGEEALRGILRYAFEELKMERVTLDHFTGNEPAAALYKKVGFQYEGIMRHGGKKNGKYVDLHLMSILRNEYFS